MEQAAPGLARRLVCRVAHPSVAEVVAQPAVAGFVDLADDAASRQLLDRLDRLVLGSAARPADGREVEGSADDRGRGKDLCRRLADGRDALDEHGLDAARDAGAGRFAAFERGDHVERQAFRLGGVGIDQPLVRDPAGLHGADDRSDLLAIEPTQTDVRHLGPPDQVVRRRGTRYRQVLAPPGQQQQHRPAGEPPGQVGKRLPARVVDEMDIVDPHHPGRPSFDQCCQRRRDGVKEAQPGARRIARRAGRRGHRTDAGGQVDQPPDLDADCLVETADAPRPVGSGEPHPQELGDRTVGDGGLARIAACGEDPPTSRTDPGRRFVGQSRLPDPGFPFDRHQAAVRRRSAPLGFDRGELDVATDQRDREGRLLIDPGARGDGMTVHSRAERRDRGRARGRLVPSVTDPVVELGGLLQRGDTELPVEQRDEVPVLADRAGPVAGAGQELDEPPLPALVERIERDPTAGGIHRAARIAGCDTCGHQPIEEVADEPLDPHRTPGLPLVELWAVADREPGQERASRERRSGDQILEPVRAGQTLEIDEIDVGGRRIEGNLCPSDRDPCLPDGGPQRRQRSSKGTPRGLVVRVRPEHRRQLVTGEGACLGGHERNDREGLPRVDADGMLRDGDLQRSEESDGEARGSSHRVTVPERRLIP